MRAMYVLVSLVVAVHALPLSRLRTRDACAICKPTELCQNFPISGVKCIPNQCVISKPCQNGGVCSADPYDSVPYRCKCPSPYIGKNCETRESCADFPCANRGWCSATYPENKPVCYCTAAFIGVHCEHKIPPSPCLSNPCNPESPNPRCEAINHIDGTSTFECLPPDPCLAVAPRSLCANEGECKPGKRLSEPPFSCRCKSAFTGPHCEDRAAEGSCTSNPCKEGTVCRHQYPAGYRCQRDKCKPINNCGVNSLFCGNMWDEDLVPQCYCKAGWTGNRCDQPEPKRYN